MRQLALITVFTNSSSLVLSCSQASRGTSAQDFYRGKTINWVVSSDAGSGSNTITRALAPFLAKETGAGVKVEAQGNEVGINFVYNEAKRDGLTLVTNSGGAAISNDILKAPGVQYEVDKFNFLGDVNPSRRVMEISPKLPQRTIEALLIPGKQVQEQVAGIKADKQLAAQLQAIFDKHKAVR
ncbi:MAG: hypothetical protein HYY30_05340 [Chloroflexi bacterium]|nr:hypothetical protein [Chloroflexota bacterium]